MKKMIHLCLLFLFGGYCGLNAQVSPSSNISLTVACVRDSAECLKKIPGNAQANKKLPPITLEIFITLDNLQKADEINVLIGSQQNTGEVKSTKFNFKTAQNGSLELKKDGNDKALLIANTITYTYKVQSKEEAKAQWVSVYVKQKDGTLSNKEYYAIPTSI